MESEKLAERGEMVGRTIRARFERLAERHPSIGDVRGLGSMLALEMVKSREGKEPDPETTKAVQAAALARGLLLLTTGTWGNVIRVLVPLTVEEEILAEGLDVLEAAFDAVAR